MKDIIEGETLPTAKREREPGMLDIYTQVMDIYIWGFDDQCPVSFCLYTLISSAHPRWLAYQSDGERGRGVTELGWGGTTVCFITIELIPPLRSTITTTTTANSIDSAYYSIL